ncbi:MAG: Translocation and assembly module TamB, partial [Chlamydiae bacterium]|nr:Translocation and assembly module TamB [Chlamydiota bacterium]
MNKVFRFFVKLIIGFVGVTALSIILLQNDGIRQTLVKAVTESIEFQTGWDIQIQKVEGLLPFQIRANNIVIQKDSQPYCEIDHVNVIISPLDLLHGSLVFTYFELQGLITHASSENPTGLPLFLRKIAVRRMYVSHLDIDGQPEDLKHLSFQGSWSFHPLNSYFSSQFLIHHDQYHCQPMSLSVIGREDQAEWEWVVKLSEGAQGLIHKYADIQVPVALEISAAIKPQQQSCEFFVQTDLSPFNLPLTIFEGTCHLIEGSKLSCKNLRGRTFEDDFTFDGDILYDTAAQFIVGELTLHPFDIQTADIQGTLDSTLSFRGPISQPSLTLNCSSPLIEVKGLSIEEFRSQTVCYLHQEEMEGEWIVTGKVNTLPLKLSFQSLSSQTLPFDIPKLAATFPSGSLEGSVHFSQDQIECQIEGEIQDLSSLHLPLKGNARFKLDTSPENDLLVIQGSEIQYEGLNIKKLTIQQDSQSLFQHFDGNYSFTAHHISWNDIQWDEMSFSTSIHQSYETWPFAFTTTSQKDDHTEINSSGQWHWDSNDFFFHLGIFTGTLFEYPFELINPINVFLSEKTMRTSFITMDIGQGKLTFEGKMEDDELNCLLDIKHLPAGVYNHFLPQTLGMNGEVSLFLRLMGPQDDIQGSMVLKGKGLQLYDEYFTKIPVSEGKLEAVLTDNQMTFEGKMTNSDNPLYVKGVIPITFSLYPFQLELTPQKPFRAHLTTSGEIAPYLQLFVTDTTNVAGHIEVDVDFGGTTDRPIVGGQATLKNGLFESLNTGFVVNDIECTLIGNDKKLILDHFTGNDSAEGHINATGFFLLDKEANYPFELSVDVDEAVLVRLDNATMTSSGHVTLTGDQKRGKIEGELTVDNAVLEIPKQLPVQMKTVEVTYINDPDEKESPLIKKQKEPWPIDMDLQFKVPSNVFVNGRDLESEWKGEFTFSGTTLKPSVHGTLQLMRGEYSFNGKSFISTQGSVNFSGDPATKTTLYVVGDQQIDNVKVQAILKGDLSDPTLVFRSNPTMSQKEILSWILFGHGIDEITPSQNDQLSQSVFTLSSGSDNPDMLSQLRTKMGIDRLDLSSSGTEEFNELSLRLGKYISRGIYVSLSKSINAEANQLAIEANLTRHLKVQAEVGDNAEGKM